MNKAIFLHGIDSHKLSTYRSKVSDISFLHSIPKTWKKRLKDSAQKLTNLDIRKVSKIKQLKKSSNYFYNELMDAIVTKPIKIQEKWNNCLSEDIAEEEWKRFYKLPAKLTIDTKLRTFQMKQRTIF